MGSRRRLLATIVCAAVGLGVGFATGRAAAEEPPAPPPAVLSAVVEVGSLPDVLGAAADVNAAVGAVLASWQEARDAVSAEWVPLGWTPEVCEPVLDGIPKVTEAPACEPIIPSVAHWHAINRCEQGGDWHAYGRFGNGLMGGGGLGMSDGAWREWGGTQFAPTAAGATPYAQMVVASRGYARHGGSPWGCKG